VAREAGVAASQDASTSGPRPAEAEGRPELDLALAWRASWQAALGGCQKALGGCLDAGVRSKREKATRGSVENRPGSTTPCMGGTAEKAASSRGVRGDLGPTPCSISR
jgi:hypothetical protein